MRRFILLFALLSLIGCSKVTQENYDKLKMGQTYGDVEAILGKPDQCEAVLVAKNCRWGKEPKVITVNFVGDKVILFTSSGL
ncbi:MAG TPA: hypothetical protein VI457_03235 [Methylococcaceae bacterium]|nr:hypothetical protein [Methylococcaceae bacterium]